jgi:ABC-type Fe3+/spermidine/putrescine transport system ATPase subunit
MCSGRIEQCGTPEEVYDSPISLFVAQFIGEANVLRGRVTASDHRYLRVETVSGGIFYCGRARSVGAEIGQSVAYLVRPEALHLDPPPRGAENTIEGTIEEVFFLGSETIYQIATADGAMMKLTVAKGQEPRIRPGLGESSRIHWRSGDAVAMALETGEGSLDAGLTARAGIPSPVEAGGLPERQGIRGSH